METPAAYIYAKIYYVCHKRKTLIPKYKRNILFYKRFIDDMFSIWTTYDDTNAWEKFKGNPLFGILGCEVEECTTSVIFLDLTCVFKVRCPIRARQSFGTKELSF